MKKIVAFWIMLLLTVVSAEAAKQGRQFYLTQDIFTGAQVLSACANGYHTASLWEILDPSDLKYNTTLGQTSHDSGSGPPSSVEFFGWIRTGYISYGVSGNPGIDNCFVWTSDDSSHKGTAVMLNYFWNGAPSTRTEPWLTITYSCNTLKAVWCVQN